MLASVFGGKSVADEAEEITGGDLPDSHEEQQQKIKDLEKQLSDIHSDLQAEIEGFFSRQFNTGVLRSMPSAGESVEIQKGWDQERIHANGRFDAWLRESEPGAELPPHEHPDHHRFVVLVEGKMTITLDPGGSGETILLSEEGKRVVHLPPGQKARAKSIEDSVTVQVFHPPVAREKVV
jgi:quercetin dioxygenase-like cupin family protein